jgi:hypothetical protein
MIINAFMYVEHLNSLSLEHHNVARKRTKNLPLLFAIRCTVYLSRLFMRMIAPMSPNLEGLMSFDDDLDAMSETFAPYIQAVHQK